MESWRVSVQVLLEVEFQARSRALVEPGMEWRPEVQLERLPEALVQMKPRPVVDLGVEPSSVSAMILE
jgi:hypothetical protein